MLTKLICRNFNEVEVDPSFSPQDNSVTSTRYSSGGENRKGKTNPEKRPGVVILSLFLNLLWRDLQVRDVKRVEGKQRTKTV